jgi:cytochrome c
MVHAMLSQRTKLLVAGTFAICLAGGAAGAVYYGWEQDRDARRRTMAITGGDPDRAPAVIAKYGCAACHQIAGIPIPGGLAAVPLNDLKQRMYVGGVLTNTPDHLIGWIVNPKRFNPRTAMPITGISEDDARDVAAHLLR